MLATSVTPTFGAWETSSASVAPAAQKLDGACALLALMVHNQAASQSDARLNVEVDWKKLQDLKQELADALRKAQEAEDSSGFFGFLSDVFGKDLAQIAGAVAAVAAVVATGGAAAPLLLVALSTALELGSKVGAELGLDPKVCMLLSLASAAVGLASGAGTGQAASALADGARAVKLGATLTEGGATVAGGSLGYVSARDHASALRYQAGAVGAQAQHDATNLDLDDALQLLERALHTEQRQTATVSAIVKDQTDTNNALGARI